MCNCALNNADTVDNHWLNPGLPPDPTPEPSPPPRRRRLFFCFAFLKCLFFKGGKNRRVKRERGFVKKWGFV